MQLCCGLPVEHCPHVGCWVNMLLIKAPFVLQESRTDVLWAGGVELRPRERQAGDLRGCTVLSGKERKGKEFLFRAVRQVLALARQGLLLNKLNSNKHLLDSRNKPSSWGRGTGKLWRTYLTTWPTSRTAPHGPRPSSICLTTPRLQKTRNYRVGRRRRIYIDKYAVVIVFIFVCLTF